MVFLKFRKCHKMVFSYYPFLVCTGVLGLDVGLLLFMKLGVFLGFFICFLYIFLLFFLWVKDVILEDLSGQYTLWDYRMFIQGFRLFLFSELTLFFTLFWTFFDASLNPLSWLGCGWSPQGILSPSYLGLNALASSFLMMNSQILKLSRRFLFINIDFCEVLMILCIFIGGGFVCFQFFEYNNNPFTFSDSVHGSIFYTGTGLHGMHVFVGVCFLVINLIRLKFFHFNWFQTQAYDMCIDYWRFLEWMWGIMFCLLYIWGS
uniref:Cytochrome c oxidase subunit 3 n=1 Tax=Thelazia callipaeda TaxID=103827 RepID=A0A343IPF0_THECL|nr:cytochrome c oxidase subunit 3 [Thelazia callipaeda]